MKLSLNIMYALAIFAFQFGSTSIQNNFESSKVALIEFEEEVLDYGTITQNSDGKRIFRFTNTGEAPLVIANVRPSCGCTVANYTKDPILFGEQGEINVSYDTKRLGTFNKSIRVISNAEDETKVLRIKGTVVKSN